MSVSAKKVVRREYAAPPPDEVGLFGQKMIDEMWGFLSSKLSD